MNPSPDRNGWPLGSATPRPEHRSYAALAAFLEGCPQAVLREWVFYHAVDLFPKTTAHADALMQISCAFSEAAIRAAGIALADFPAAVPGYPDGYRDALPLPPMPPVDSVPPPPLSRPSLSPFYAKPNPEDAA